MAKKKAEEFIEKIETPETIAVVGADGEPIAVSGVVPQESTDIDSETGSEIAASDEEASPEPTAKTADLDYDPFRFPVEPEATIFAVAGTGHSHEVIDGYVSCEECHAALYPEPVVEIESYSFDASEQES